MDAESPNIQKRWGGYHEHQSTNTLSQRQRGSEVP